MNRFLEKPSLSIVQIGTETAEIFAESKKHLKIAGSPIPINDLWISAQAIEQGSVLISFDNHFNKVPGVRVWDQSIFDE